MFQESTGRHFAQMPVEAFLEALASDDPVPGAGPASAHAGAVAAAIVHFVAGNNLRRSRDTDRGPWLVEVHEESELLREEFSDLVGEDADIYHQVMAALALPKDTDAEKKTRSRVLESAMKHATEVPLRIMERALATYRLAERLVRDGSKTAAPDALLAVELAVAVIRGNAAMVSANVGRLEDAEYRRRALCQSDRILAALDVEAVRSIIHLRGIAHEENS